MHTDVLGLESKRVRLIPHCEEWGRLYQAEAKLIMAAFGERALSVEHVGSTAVPGLAAKPVLDVLVGVASLDQAGEWLSILEALDYEFHPDEEIPDRLFFRRLTFGRRTHHLSLAEPTSDFYLRTVLFRDYLTAHAEETAAYGALKRELAARHPNDREAYVAGKTSFITEALARGRHWAQG